MTTFEFNSQVCTTKAQSEKLLALGLKKETADMYRPPSWGGDKIIGYYAPAIVLFNDHFVDNPNDLPAWSLHRLMEIDNVGVIEFYNNDIPNIYDHMVNYIEKRIKMGLINPEYLEERK